MNVIADPLINHRYESALNDRYLSYGCGNVTLIMKAACEARSPTSEFGTPYYPVGLHGYRGCEFCEENERSESCRKYPDSAWAWDIQPDAKPANPGFWYEWSYQPTTRCGVPEYDMRPPPFENCTDASWRETHGWCECESAEFDELVERSEICATRKEAEDAEAYFAARNVLENPAFFLLDNFDAHLTPETGTVAVGARCSLANAESCAENALNLAGLRIAVIAPEDSDLGEISVDGDPDGIYLGAHSQSLYTAPGGNGSALAASLGAKISASGLLAQFPIGVGAELMPSARAPRFDRGTILADADTSPREWRGSEVCHADLYSASACFAYELLPIVSEGVGSRMEVDEAMRERREDRMDYTGTPRRCVGGPHRQYPGANMEEQRHPQTMTKCYPHESLSIEALSIGHNVTVQDRFGCWTNADAVGDRGWARSDWIFTAVYVAINRTDACTDLKCALTSCAVVNESDIGSGDGYQFGSGSGDPAWLPRSNPRCDSILPEIRANCDAEISRLSSACASGGVWRTPLPPSSIDESENVSPSPPGSSGDFCLSTVCSSFGMDCCAPWGELQTCSLPGYEPRPIGDCDGDPEGWYECCTTAPPPPPLVDGLFPNAWAQWPFTLAEEYASAHSLDPTPYNGLNATAPLEVLWNDCVPPLCFNFDTSNGGSQPTRVDAASGATVPDCEVDAAGLEPYVHWLEQLHPCSVRASAHADRNARDACSSAASYLSPAHLPTALGAPLDAQLLPECTVASMLPGVCIGADLNAENDCTRRITQTCDGGAGRCDPLVCPLLGYFVVPRYERFASRAELDRYLIDNQQAVRTSDDAVPLPRRANGRAGRLPQYPYETEYWQDPDAPPHQT